MVDFKFYSANKTYWIQQIPLEPTIEIDLQGVKANTDINKIIILKISVYEPGEYFISNLRFGRLNPPVNTRAARKFNLIPNGDFEFGLTGFEFYNGEGLYSMEMAPGRLGKSFKFSYQNSDGNGKSSAFIYSGYIDLKSGEYDFSVWSKSDMVGKFRWFLVNDDKQLDGQYWIDSGTSTLGWSESKASFKLKKDGKVRAYFAVYSPTSFYVDNMRISPKKQKVEIKGNQFVLNGVPEHLIGVYHGTREQVAEVGFRHHKPDYLANQSDVDFYNAHGIYLWGDISGLVRLKLTESVQDIEMIYNQSNLVGFYEDEPDHVKQYTSPALCRKITGLLKQTGLPTLGVVMSWYKDSSASQQYSTSFNIEGSDIYAFANKQPLTWLQKKIENYLKVKSDKPRIVVVEAGDYLTYGEQRAQAWLPMACGADGVFFWVLTDVKDSTNLKSVIKELDSFRYLTGLGIRLDSNVPCCVKSQAQPYIVGVNPSADPVEVVIRPTFQKQITPVLGASGAVWTDAIRFHCEAYEPFVLKVT
jgi:hypothetical protein